MVTHESYLWVNDSLPFIVSPTQVKVPPYFPDHPDIRSMMARCYSNIEIMDKQVGDLLNQLEEDGLMDSTIIFFYSDHGGPYPRHKREMLDAGLRVPFLVVLPNKKGAGRTVDELVSFIDFGATVLSLAGIPIPNSIQGQAFMGAQRKEARKYIFAARDRMDTEIERVRAVRDLRFKYIRNYYPEKPNVQNISYRLQIKAMRTLLSLDSLGLLSDTQAIWFRKTRSREELYDVLNDPHELNNLIDNPAYQEKIDELRKAMDDWQVKYGDKGAIPEKEMIKNMWRGDTVPQAAPPKWTVQPNGLHLSCKTPGSSIVYRLGEKESWKLYTHPIEISAINSIEFMAERIGYRSSFVVEYKNDKFSAK